MVAKGFNQVEGVDYFDSFSSVAKSVTVKFFLVVAALKGYFFYQLDVNNTFFHGYLQEHVYMNPPPSYSVPKGHVCKLLCSLYGLKQASRQWNIELTTQLLSIGFVASEYDHCLFVHSDKDGFVALLVYVDDILVMSSFVDLINQVKSFLHAQFTIKDIGPAKYFLGLEIARSKKGIYINQRKYILDLVTEAELYGSKPCPTPMSENTKLITKDGDLLEDPEKYRRLVGRLLYLGFTRPDIAFATHQLSQFVTAPC